MDIKRLSFPPISRRAQRRTHRNRVHGGVSRNVVEDIANVELRPHLCGVWWTTPAWDKDVIDKLARHKVNTRFIQKVPDGMGTWLAIF